MKISTGLQGLALRGLLVVGLIGAVQSARSYVPEPPTVTLTATDPDAAEIGPDTGTFRVTRSGGDSSLPLVVYFETPTGTATSETDYEALPTYVTIAAYQSTTNIPLTPILDTNCGEGDETVILTLATNANYLVGWPDSGTVTIADVPSDGDSDGDGMLDCWELEHFEDLDETADGNPDGDVLTNLQEFLHGTDPNEDDTTLDASNAIGLQVYTPLK